MLLDELGSWVQRGQGGLAISGLAASLGFVSLYVEKDYVAIRMSGKPLGTLKSEAVGQLKALLHHLSQGRRSAPLS